MIIPSRAFCKLDISLRSIALCSDTNDFHSVSKFIYSAQLQIETSKLEALSKKFDHISSLKDMAAQDFLIEGWKLSFQKKIKLKIYIFNYRGIKIVSPFQGKIEAGSKRLYQQKRENKNRISPFIWWNNFRMGIRLHKGNDWETIIILNVWINIKCRLCLLFLHSDCYFSLLSFISLCGILYTIKYLLQ